MTPMCAHDPNNPWAYNRHKRRGEDPCDASKEAWAYWMRLYRISTGRTKNQLVPYELIPYKENP